MPEPISCPFQIVIDTREQSPWSFRGLTANADKKNAPIIVDCTTSTLPTGDYSIAGFENYITIERKSLSDAFGTFTHDRERWERELERMRKIPSCHVVIEGSWQDLKRGPAPKPNYGEVEFEGFDSTDDFSCPSVHAESGPTESDIHSAKIGKAVIRSILAWSIRYQNVHWWFHESRAEAEETAFRLLEKFWEDDQWQVKQLKKLGLEISTSYSRGKSKSSQGSATNRGKSSLFPQ